MTQLGLEWNPPTAPLPSLADNSVHPDDEAPLKESALRMYERLLRGPATNRELEDAGAGERIAARRLDLNVWFRKRHMPWFIPKGKRLGTRGVTEYRLEAFDSSSVPREEVRTDCIAKGGNPRQPEEPPRA